MTLVIATGGIDLSVGAVMAISGAVAASLADSQPIAVALLAALAVGVACGLWNALLIALFRIQPIVATLILMVAGRGTAHLIPPSTILPFSSPNPPFMVNGPIMTIPTPNPLG